MVRRIFNLVGREIKGLHQAAYLLAIFSFISLILGLLRDRLLAYEFGASLTLDVYYSSFRIPDLLFVIMTSLVSASVLVPVFSKHLDNKQELKKYIDSLFTIFLILMIFISVGFFFFVPFLLKFTAPGLIDSELSGQLILFTRILLLSPILLGISQLFGGIVQAYRKFIIYAISPILYNLGIIVGIVYFYPIWGPVGLILGVCLGLILHLLTQIPFICKRGLMPQITLKLNLKIIKQVFFLSVPRTITMASSQLILIILIALASMLEAGSISVFNFAFNLQSVPLTIIGVSYSLAAFPTLAKFFHDGEMENFLGELVIAVRHIVFWSLPIISLFVVLRAQIVRTILGAGEFSWSDTRLTAAALAIFIISTLSQSLILIFVRAYYAAGKTSKPLFINLISALTTVLLSFVLIYFYDNSDSFRTYFENLLRVDGNLPSTILMLPLAFSIGMILNSVILWICFEKDFTIISDKIKKTAFHSLVSSIFGGIVAYISLGIADNFLNLNTLPGVFFQGLISGIAGIFAVILVLIVLKNPEIKDVWKAMNFRIFKARNKIVTTGQQEL